MGPHSKSPFGIFFFFVTRFIISDSNLPVAKYLNKITACCNFSYRFIVGVVIFLFHSGLLWESDYPYSYRIVRSLWLRINDSSTIRFVYLRDRGSPEPSGRTLQTWLLLEGQKFLVISYIFIHTLKTWKALCEILILIKSNSKIAVEFYFSRAHPPPTKVSICQKPHSKYHTAQKAHKLYCLLYILYGLAGGQLLTDLPKFILVDIHLRDNNSGRQSGQQDKKGPA